MLFFKKIKEKITSKKKNDKSNVLQNLKKAESLGEIATILALGMGICKQGIYQCT